MRTQIRAAAAALGIVVVALVFAPQADAHTARQRLVCGAASAHGERYNPDVTNTVQIVLDGKQVVYRLFTSSYSWSALLTKTEGHRLQVTVRAGDKSRYNVDYDRSIEACQSEQTSSSPCPTLTPTPASSAPGSSNASTSVPASTNSSSMTTVPHSTAIARSGPSQPVIAAPRPQLANTGSPTRGLLALALLALTIGISMLVLAGRSAHRH